MMQVSSAIQASSEKSGAQSRMRRAAFAAAATVGVISLAQCAPQSPYDVSGKIPLKAALLAPPATLSEELAEPTRSELNGKLTACRGSASCSIDVEPGDILISFQFLPEQEGHIEISVIRTGDPGVSFEQRTDTKFGEPLFEYQTVRSGESARLFNTDLAISVRKGDAGMFFVNLE